MQSPQVTKCGVFAAIANANALQLFSCLTECTGRVKSVSHVNNNMLGVPVIVLF